MKCTVAGCPGNCEDRLIAHTATKDDQVVVIDRVPAEVCSLCGDVLLAPDTVRRLEQILSNPDQPARTVPL